HDTVAEQDCNQCLPPIHTSADQSRRQHVRWNAVRHADPKRGVVVGGPVPIGNLYGREVAIEEGTRADFAKSFSLQFDTAVRILNCFVSFMRAQAYRSVSVSETDQ